MSRLRRLNPRLVLEELESRLLLSVTDLTSVAQLFAPHPGPTILYLNFDGGTINYQGGTETVLPFQGYSAGKGRDADAQTIIDLTSRLFAPFNVQVGLLTGDGVFDQSSNGYSTIFVGPNGLGMSHTPSAFSDFPGTFKGTGHVPNSDAYDIGFVHVLPSSSAVAISDSVAHEAGHTFGLVHVLTAPDPDLMSYDANNSFFVDKSFSITDLNGNPPQHDVSLSPQWNDNGNLMTITTQNSYTYLKAVLGPSQVRQLSGDVNGDSRADLIFLGQNWKGPGLNVSTFLANGDGTFNEINQVLGDPAEVTSGYVATADINGDGRSDLLFAWIDPVKGLLVRTALSNGFGFWSATKETVLGDSAAVLVKPFLGDVNSDGRSDLILLWPDVSRGLVATTHVSNVDGSMGPAQETVLGEDPVVFGQPLLADLNRDQRPDLIFPYYDSGQGTVLHVHLSQPNGTWGPTIETVPGSGLADFDHALVGDVNGDFRPDLHLLFADPALGLVVNTYLANPDGTWQPVKESILGDSPATLNRPYLGDLNGDGRGDLLLPWYDPKRGLVVTTHQSNSDGSWQPAKEIVLGDAATVLSHSFLGDSNGDGLSDLIFSFGKDWAEPGLHLLGKLATGAWGFVPSKEQIRATLPLLSTTISNIPPATLPLAAQAFSKSVEYYTNFVTSAYQRYLGRLPDAPGLSSWVVAMQHGLTDERLEAGFIGSPEYIQNHGGNGSEWVRGMYRDLLGRDPQQSEVDAWVSNLSRGLATEAIAYGFAASAEREGQRVAADYSQYLLRSAGQAEIKAWVNVFLHGVTNETVIGGFVGSPEYFARHGGTVRGWLKSVYRDVLGRYPEEGEYPGWLSYLS